MFFRTLVMKRPRKAPIRTNLVCWIDVLRETTRRFHNTNVVIWLGNMTPWTKALAIQQHNLGSQRVKPWECYDCSSGNIASLPAGPVEQVQIAWYNFVVSGAPQFPAQVYVSSDRWQSPQAGTAVSGRGVPPPRFFGDDVAPLRMPPRNSGSPGQFGLAGSQLNQGSTSLFPPTSSSRPSRAPMLDATPSALPPSVQMTPGVVPDTIPVQSCATGSSTSPASHVASQSDHDAFMAMTMQWAWPAQASTTDSQAGPNIESAGPSASESFQMSETTSQASRDHSFVALGSSSYGSARGISPRNLTIASNDVVTTDMARVAPRPNDSPGTSPIDFEMLFPMSVPDVARQQTPQSFSSAQVYRVEGEIPARELD